MRKLRAGQPVGLAQNEPTSDNWVRPKGTRALACGASAAPGLDLVVNWPGESGQRDLMVWAASWARRANGPGVISGEPARRRHWTRPARRRPDVTPAFLLHRPRAQKVAWPGAKTGAYAAIRARGRPSGARFVRNRTSAWWSRAFFDTGPSAG